VVEKIWNFEVSAILWIFLRLMTFLELFLKFQGPKYDIRDCGLIFEKPKGFFAKLPGIIDFGIILVRKKTWTQSTGRGPHLTYVHGGPRRLPIGAKEGERDAAVPGVPSLDTGRR
jgi:hypothetical protein